MTSSTTALSLRDTSTDGVRMLSLVGIIIAHFGTYPETGAFHILWSWGNGIAPIWFALLVGVSSRYSSRKGPQRIIDATLILILGIVLASLTQVVIVVLAPLGLGMLALAVLWKTNPYIRAGIGSAMLAVSPVISSIVDTGCGTDGMQSYTMTLPGITSLNAWLQLIVGGTYPGLEWCGWVLIGSTLYYMHSLAGNLWYKVMVCVPPVLGLGYYLLSPSYPDSSMAYRVCPPDGISHITPWSLYGHTGSYVSFLVGISTFLMTWMLLRYVPGIWWSLMGRYSLTIYMGTTVFREVTGDGGVFWVSAIILVSVVFSWWMCRRGYRDPLASGVHHVADFVFRLIPVNVRGPGTNTG